MSYSRRFAVTHKSYIVARIKQVSAHHQGFRPGPKVEFHGRIARTSDGHSVSNVLNRFLFSRQAGRLEGVCRVQSLTASVLGPPACRCASDVRDRDEMVARDGDMSRDKL